MYDEAWLNLGVLKDLLCMELENGVPEVIMNGDILFSEKQETKRKEYLMNEF